MATLTECRPEADIDTSITLLPPCEARLPRCGNPASVIVRFDAHGCSRDGHGVLLCGACRDWIVKFSVGCAACGGNPPEVELRIVSSVKL